MSNAKSYINERTASLCAIVPLLQSEVIGMCMSQCACATLDVTRDWQQAASCMLVHEPLFVVAREDGLLQQEVARCRKGRDKKGAGDAAAKACLGQFLSMFRPGIGLERQRLPDPFGTSASARFSSHAARQQLAFCSVML